MINQMNLHKYLWADVNNTACHVLNRIVIRPILHKTPYELLKGRKPNLSYLRVFGCKCFILNNRKDKLGKFDAKVDEGIFLRYSSTNKRTLIVEESAHVDFDETPPQVVGKGTSFDVAGIILSRMVTNKMFLRKTRTTKIRNFWNTFTRMKNKKHHHCLLMIGSPRETTLWKIFLATSRRE